MDSKILTHFSSDMFSHMHNSPLMQECVDYYQPPPPPSFSIPTHNLTRSKPHPTAPIIELLQFVGFFKDNIELRLEELEMELADLKARRQQQELEIENIENIALRQRFQDILDRLLQEQLDKEHERYELRELLKQPLP